MVGLLQTPLDIFSSVISVTPWPKTDLIQNQTLEGRARGTGEKRVSYFPGGNLAMFRVLLQLWDSSESLSFHCLLEMGIFFYPFLSIFQKVRILGGYVIFHGILLKDAFF